MLTVLASLLASVVAITIRLVRPDQTPSGLTTVILIVLFIGGVQLAATSIIGSYLSHIYDEVKKRPPFIVESVLNPPTVGEAKETQRDEHALGRARLGQPTSLQP